jgi:hypothetical protein
LRREPSERYFVCSCDNYDAGAIGGVATLGHTACRCRSLISIARASCSCRTAFVELPLRVQDARPLPVLRRRHQKSRFLVQRSRPSFKSAFL